MFDDPLTKAMDATAPLWVAVAAPRPGALPVAACRAGWGDGAYPTWLGHAADGSVVLVLSDFFVVDDPFGAVRPHRARVLCPSAFRPVASYRRQQGEHDGPGGTR